MLIIIYSTTFQYFVVMHEYNAKTPNEIIITPESLFIQISLSGVILAWKKLTIQDLNKKKI